MPDILRSASPLENVTVKAGGSSASFQWKVPGTPVVRVLRSTEWYPETPNDFLSGTFLAQRVHETRSTSFVDASIRHDEEYFYSLFAQKKDGAWCAPVRVHVFGAEGPQAITRSVELYGHAQRATAGENLGLWMTIMLPTLMMVGVLGMALATGFAAAAFTAIGLASASGWRLVRLDTELWGLVKVLAVPAVAFAALILSGGWIWVESTILGADVIRGGDVGKELLWMALSLAAVTGAWALARLAFTDSTRPDSLRAGLILIVPAAVGLVAPQVAIVAMAVVAGGVLLYERGREQPAPG
jgi:hypothetical protein